MESRYKSEFNVVVDNKLVHVEMAVVSHTGQPDYISFQCTDPEAAIKKMPELKPVAEAAGLWAPGRPLHEVDNLKYFLQEAETYRRKDDKKFEAQIKHIMSHLRVDRPHVIQIFNEYVQAHTEEEVQKVISHHLSVLRPVWEGMYSQAVEIIKQVFHGRTYQPRVNIEYEEEAVDMSVPLLIVEDCDPIEVDKVWDHYGILIVDAGLTYAVAPSVEDAQQAVKEYWEDMAENDPREFACLIGEERLVRWGMNQVDSYGIRNIQNFFDAVSTNDYITELASYDGEERHGQVNYAFADEYGFPWPEDLDEETGWMDVLVYRQ